jgi:hypothetical protein
MNGSKVLNFKRKFKFFLNDFEKIQNKYFV